MLMFCLEDWGAWVPWTPLAMPLGETHFKSELHQNQLR